MSANEKNTTKVSCWALMILVLLGTSSCATSYVPNLVNTPIFGEKDELQAAAYYGTSGFDGQIAYAVSDHMGIMINGSFIDRRSETSSDFHKHSFLEFGAGYFKKIRKDRVFEIYGGGGFGSTQTNEKGSIWEPNADVSNQRFFLQPSVGFTTDFIDGSIGMRIVHVQLSQEIRTETAVFVEPVSTAKFGYKNIKVVGQMGFSFPWAKKEVKFNHEKFWMSIGLHGRLNMGK